MWDWHGEGYCLQKETNLDISPCLWDGVSQNEEDLSYMFDETTPVKACGDLAYHVADNVNMDKELQQCTEMSSQVKRRRMLQFDNEILGSPLCNEEISSVFLKSKVRDLVEASNMYGTLNNVLDVDVKNDTVRTQGSLSCNLRRVRQGLDLIRAIFENFLSSEYVPLFYSIFLLSHLLKCFLALVIWKNLCPPIQAR
ncbi:protein XRI1-like isoform X2 [Camellia sinensis]|uniref:protein XRI1-like isoform X2 n=1 Tax=Camellia sinensis TaxID=4442 RepID=UPI0010364A88|nr:protein XRI1-like isoform X2 [Camellia sinensis]